MSTGRLAKWGLWVLVLLSLALASVGCGPEKVVVTEIVEGQVVEKIVTATPASEEASPAPDTLVVLLPATPPGFDPDVWGGKFWEMALVNVYDSVMDYEMVSEEEIGIPKGTGIGGVAKVNGMGDEGIVGNFFESWEISPDGQTVTLHVRNGLKSYWGHQATADDWLWRVQRAFALKDVGQFQLQVMGITGPEDVKKIDDMTIEMHTPRGPSPIFFKGLCVPVLFGVDIDEMKKEGLLTEEDPWGTEAFKKGDFGFGADHVAEFVPGSHVKFVANPYYWKGEPTFKTVIMREVPESSNRFAMVVNGEAHLTEELSLVQKNELRAGLGEAVLLGLPDTNFMLNIFAQRSTGPFAKKECFQALGYAVPYEDIHRLAYMGFGRVMHEAIPRMFGPNVNLDALPYSYDPDKAAELWKAGNCPSSFRLMYDAVIPEWEDIAILLRTEFAKFGVDVILDKQAEGTVTANLSKHDFDAVIEWSSAAFVADVGYGAWLYWHKDSFANFQAWYDDETSAKIDQSMLMLPGPERTALLHEVQVKLLAEGGKLPVLNTGWQIAANKHLHGFYWYSTQKIRWFDLTWE